MHSETKIALVTGAGSGIGRAVAQAYLRAGYAVVLSGRREAALRQTVERMGADASHVVIVPTDIRDPVAVAALFAAARAAFGRLDVLFNNAGTWHAAQSIEAFDYETWREVLETNVSGAFLCTQHAVRLMKSQRPMGGRIINNGSIAAHAPRPGSAPYTVSKHAITGLTKSTALDGRKYDIACGQIDIGNAYTDMTAKMAEGVPQADGSIAPEPTMDADHVAEAVLYMTGLPLAANVQFMTITATKMPFIGRG